MPNITPQVARALSDGFFSFDRNKIQQNTRCRLASLDNPQKEDIVL